MSFELTDAAFVKAVMLDASITAFAMRNTGPRLGMKVSKLDVFDKDEIMYEHNARPARPPMPSAEAIQRMDETMRWLLYIPNMTIRRIVAARAVTDAMGRPQSWRSIGKKLGISHHSAKAWHAQGIAQIVAALNALLVEG
jgi:hypothetical protein